MRFTLDDPPFANRTGRGVIVAVLDSGIHADHPHVGGVQGGISFVEPNTADTIDRIGHGTAVAAAIREKSPDVSLLAVKIFGTQLATSADVLVRAITWAADRGAALINLSLGTANPMHAATLAEVVDYASERGAVVISAGAANGVQWLPGSFDTAVDVRPDAECDRDAIEVEARRDALPRIHASTYPRPIPGVPRERNLSGVSFAVANVTGFLARAIEGTEASAIDVVRSLMC